MACWGTYGSRTIKKDKNIVLNNLHEIVPTLLNMEINLYQGDEEGNTAMHIACSTGSIETIVFFI